MTYGQNLKVMTADALQQGVPTPEIIYSLQMMLTQMSIEHLTLSEDGPAKPKIFIPEPHIENGGRG